MTFHHCHLHHSAPHDLSVPCLLCSLAQLHLLHIGDYLEAPKQAVCVISHSLPLHAQFPVPDMLPAPVLVDLALPACSGRFNYSLPSRNPLLTLLLPEGPRPPSFVLPCRAQLSTFMALSPQLCPSPHWPASTGKAEISVPAPLARRCVPARCPCVDTDRGAVLCLLTGSGCQKVALLCLLPWCRPSSWAGRGVR